MEVESNRVARHLKTPPPGTRPERLADARAPQGAGACGVPTLRSPSPSPVVMVQEAAHDDKTVTFFLAQSFGERQRRTARRRVEEEEEVQALTAVEQLWSGRGALFQYSSN